MSAPSRPAIVSVAGVRNRTSLAGAASKSFGRLAAWLLPCLLSGAVGVHAHEIGTTRVTAVFQQPGRYEINIVTDAAALLEKLDTIAMSRPVGSSDPATLGERLAARDDVFRQRIGIAFDEPARRPAISYSVSPPADALSPPTASIRLMGEVPEGATHFTWTYGWTFASYALALKSREAGDVSTQWLEGGEQSAAYPLVAPMSSPGRATTAWRYLALGFTHIVPYGLDHMLFVIGIFLLGGHLRTVLWQVSAFTVAHSITLGLSIYGWLAVPPGVVEPLIAVSIAYVAIENLFLKKLKPWRVALVFGFGLLHGMGFAGALSEIGLPRSEFLTALLTFNIGVEAGQLAVIAAAFVLVGWQCSHRAWYRSRVVIPASAAIACTALYWTAARIGL